MSVDDEEKEEIKNMKNTQIKDTKIISREFKTQQNSTFKPAIDTISDFHTTFHDHKHILSNKNLMSPTLSPSDSFMNLGSKKSLGLRNQKQVMSTRNVNSSLNGVSTEGESHAGFVHDLVRKWQIGQEEKVKMAMALSQDERPQLIIRSSYSRHRRVSKMSVNSPIRFY